MASTEPLLNEKEATEADSAKFREFSVLDAQANAASNFAGNAVSTSIYSFFPLSIHFVVWKNLFEQFHKAANVYFLLISGLQLIPGISPTGRFTTLMPLMIVLTVTMIKDVFEDVKRHRSDAELNSRKACAWRGGIWEDDSVQWKDIHVGELLRVKNNSPFPADLILVWSPNFEGGCYIETANLDGETNLKIRKAVNDLYKSLHTPQPQETEPHKVIPPSNPDILAGRIVCELPNNRLYNFDGYYTRPGPNAQKIPLSADNILLRGANLRNTPLIYGIVVFTGPETKLMKNSAAKETKMSRIDHVTNRQILFVFIFLLILCLACTLGATVVSRTASDRWYLPVQGASSLVATIFGSFATFLILFNNLIPISLYVTVEVVKLVLASYINNDVEMYYEETDTPANARTSSLCEELGQVEYIFSDKTGTLTCNRMDFLKFTCLRYDRFQQTSVVVSYGTGTTEIGRAAAAREGRTLKDDRPPGWQPKDGQCFYDPRVSDLMWLKQPNAEALEFFFAFLAVCHAVIPEKEEGTGKLIYQAASPDEECLVKAAAFFGVKFVEKTAEYFIIEVNGKREKWDILNIIEFDSTRKRMSVICNDPKGRLLLLCKGADTVIYERLKQDAKTAQIREETLSILTQFAAEGLRTLVLGMVELDVPTYHRWRKKYKEAECSLENRAAKMAAVAEEIETDLELVGTTAIEDKLQIGVPQTIELLSNAGIKIWVLTGDKQETAINIGFACALLHNDMGLFMFDECNKSNINSVLHTYLQDAKQVTQQDLGLVIQGDMLHNILPEEDQPDKPESEIFLALATRCRAVICCRVSPLQKALVVKLVRDHMDTVSLAIGDGANDVSMIQAAHVGIGIQGLEGLQAARASDYSIGQFRYLQRLLLIHGRYAYRRVGKVILYCFYKNVSMFLTQLWFTAFNLVTGQSLYDQWSLSGYNMSFTAAAIVMLGIFDRDVDPEALLSKEMFPELYHDGMKNLLFNTVVFWMYMINAIAHSIICFFLPLYALELATMPDTGLDLGLVGTGVTAYTCVLGTVTLKVCFEAELWTIPNVVVNLGSIGMWFIFLGIYGNLFPLSTITSFAWWYGLPALILSHPMYWLTVLLTCTLAILREISWKCWKHNFSQKLMHIVQEFKAQGKKFTRRDVLRCAPHLLPRFDALRPYELGGGATTTAESEINMATLAGVTRNFFGANLKQGAHVGSETVKKKAHAPRAPSSSFRSQPGKVKIKDIILDEL